MRIFKVICYLVFLFLVSLMFAAVSQAESNLKPQPIKFGHDKCQRCMMKIRSPYFSAEVGNPLTGKVYKFDDIGCAVMWLYHDCHFNWSKEAVVWVTDAKTGKWLNAEDACWVDGMMTPMHFGLGAFKKGEIGKKCLNWNEAKRLLLERGIKKEKMMMKRMPKILKMKLKKMCTLK